MSTEIASEITVEIDNVAAEVTDIRTILDNLSAPGVSLDDPIMNRKSNSAGLRIRQLTGRIGAIKQKEKNFKNKFTAEDAKNIKKGIKEIEDAIKKLNTDYDTLTSVNSRPDLTVTDSAIGEKKGYVTVQKIEEGMAERDAMLDQMHTNLHVIKGLQETIAENLEKGEEDIKLLDNSVDRTKQRTDDATKGISATREVMKKSWIPILILLVMIILTIIVFATNGLADWIYGKKK